MIDETLRGADQLAFRNIEAEQCCLGAALQDSQSVQRLKTMDISDFTEPKHQALYSAILENFSNGMPADLVTLHKVLSKQNMLDLVGGDVYLMTLIRNVPTTANMTYYVRLVQECTSRRKLKAIGESLIIESGHLDEDVDNIREKAALSVREVRGSGDVHVIMQRDAVLSTFESLEQAQRREGQESKRIFTGIKQLDTLTGGLYGSKLIVIGARPSVGKTAFSLAICMNAAMHGKKILYASLEMPESQLVEREFATESLVPLNEITSENISADGWQKMAKSVGTLSNLPIGYITKINSVEELRKAAFKLYENNGLDLICVDYIQLLRTKQKRNNRQEEVADFSRELKWLAQELNIPVIVNTQLNRENAREKRPPTMADARESGAIEQDADIFILLHEPDPSELKTEELQRIGKDLRENGLRLLHINVDKNRQGTRGVFFTAFDGAHMRFLGIKKDS